VRRISGFIDQDAVDAHEVFLRQLSMGQAPGIESRCGVTTHGVTHPLPVSVEDEIRVVVVPWNAGHGLSLR
jgi:hypothetical protein